MGNTDCKGCSAADPATDTVKANVDGGTLLTSVESADKLQEQVQDLQKKLEQDEQQQALREAEAQREREEQERKRLLEEALRMEQRVREEALRMEQEEAERVAADEAARKTNEEKQRAAEEAANKEAQQKSGAFLKSHGFKSAVHPKTSCMKVSYPLHVAVQENKADVVAALLHCGADKQVRNKAGQTPLKVALTANKNASHQAVIAALA